MSFSSSPASHTPHRRERLLNLATLRAGDPEGAAILPPDGALMETTEAAEGTVADPEVES